MSPDGVPITRAEFDEQLDRYLAALDDPDAELSDDDYVAITRLWNTIQHGPPSAHEERMAAFQARVFPVEVQTVTQALGMELSKGDGAALRGPRPLPRRRAARQQHVRRPGLVVVPSDLVNAADGWPVAE